MEYRDRSPKFDSRTFAKEDAQHRVCDHACAPILGVCLESGYTPLPSSNHKLINQRPDPIPGLHLCARSMTEKTFTGAQIAESGPGYLHLLGNKTTAFNHNTRVRISDDNVV